jgi:hypothetical protein
MSEYYQVIHSRVSDREAMLALRPEFISAARALLPGLIDARLIELDDGTWLDIVRWSSASAAEEGGRRHADIPEAAEMGRLIAEVTAIYQGVDVDGA